MMSNQKITKVLQVLSPSVPAELILSSLLSLYALSPNFEDEVNLEDFVLVYTYQNIISAHRIFSGLYKGGEALIYIITPLTKEDELNLTTYHLREIPEEVTCS